MGNIVLPSTQDYWKSDDLYDFPVFRNTMNRLRFNTILRFLTFSNESDSDDRLGKVRYLSNHFNKIMEEQYYPSRELCIDESMMGFKGRLLFRQFIKNKKHKFGVKFYILTEPNGLILKHRIYDGTKIDFDGSSSATESIVLDLMKNYLSKGHSLYMDNFYNSIKLSERLLEFATYSTGTLRSNRKLNPRDVVDAKLKKGEIISRYSYNVGITKWRDTKEVTVISTEFNGDVLNLKNRWGKNIRKPTSIHSYNQNMDGIDRMDQMISYYTNLRKTSRWHMKVNFRKIEMIIHNSHILYATQASKKIPLREFREEIIKDLLKKETPPPKEIRKRPLFHCLLKFEKLRGSKVTQRKRCIICAKSNIRRDTSYYCGACYNDPPLCIKNCFSNYHLENY
uniref:DDE_Tnp_1_7 domain-containing protein n=1 Tax=Strongyloides papillosus TaxID=174720 RepID=A0A0N5BQU6_STREA